MYTANALDYACMSLTSAIVYILDVRHECKAVAPEDPRSDFASYAPLFAELEQAQLRLSDDAAVCEECDVCRAKGLWP